MKKILLIITFFFGISNFCISQSSFSGSKPKDFIFQFYSSLFSIYEDDYYNKIGATKLRKKKIDSLLKVYCTPNLREKALKALYNDYGNDLMTNDQVGDKNENLKVIEIKKNEFIVTFNSISFDQPGGTFKQLVKLKVIILFKGENFMIQSVE